ncbi:MAG TPA: hypothetical protein VFU02_10845 [Polyangiaceae bacterium]|nr:hypothetical protein [Polyangiaceae bacterium]
MHFDCKLAALPIWVLLGACGKDAVQQTGYAGDGRYEGQPPMCFQVDTQVRPSASTQYHLMALFNNTCRYAVTCDVTNSVNDNEQQVNVPANMNRNLLIALNSDERRFDIDLFCSWTP